jgi:hypothetical protein
MEKPGPRIPWLGIALILFGALLLVNKLDLVDISFHQIFWPIVMLLGLVGVGRGFGRGKRGKIFFGTLVFLFGLYFLLHSIDRFEIGGHLIVASSFLIFGIAFLMVWFNDVRDWYYLIPAALSGGVGVALLGSELGYLSHWEVLDAVRVYWPLALILFGVGMILRRKMHSSSDTTPAAPAPPAP